MNTSQLVQEKDSFSHKLLDTKDKFLLAVSIISFFLFIYLLLSIKDPIHDLRDLTPIATVGQSQDNAKRRISGSLSWSDVKKGQDLFRGDYIFTDNQSSVEVDFIDETILQIPSNSLVKIDFSDNLFHFNVIKGLLDINLGKKVKKINIKLNGKKYEIKSNRAKIRVQREGKKVNIFSKSGQAEILSQGKRKALVSTKNGHSILNNSIKKIATPLEVLSPSSGQIFDPIKNPTISFKWNSPGDAKSKILISKSASFVPSETKTFEQPEKEKKELHLRPINPGTFFYKILQNSKDGVSRQSPVRSYTINSPDIPIFFQDMNLISIDAKRGSPTIISWDEKYSGTYDIKLISQKGEESSLQINGNNFEINDSNTKNLSWSIKHASPMAKWITAKPLSIRYHNDLDVELPGENGKIIKFPRQEFINFNWNALPSESFSIKLYPLADPTTPLYDKIIVGNKVKLPMPTTGKYLWHISSLTHSGVEKKDIPLHVLTHAVRNMHPKHNDTVIIESKEKNDIKLTWEIDAEVKDDIKFSLAKDSEFTDIIDSEINNEKSKIIDLTRPGKYYWKLEYSGDNKNIINSTPLSFNLSYPKILSPPVLKRKQILYYRNKKGISSNQIRVPTVAGAVSYEIEVYKDKNLQQLVFRKKSDKNIIYWVSKRSGQFSMRARVWDKFGRKSNFSNTGTLLFPISPLAGE